MVFKVKGVDRMINASEARQRSMKNIDFHVKMQLEMLDTLIANAADRGETSLTLECFLLPEVKNKLTAFGYSINSTFVCNKQQTVISWRY